MNANIGFWLIAVLITLGVSHTASGKTPAQRESKALTSRQMGPLEDPGMNPLKEKPQEPAAAPAGEGNQMNRPLAEGLVAPALQEEQSPPDKRIASAEQTVAVLDARVAADQGKDELPSVSWPLEVWWQGLVTGTLLLLIVASGYMWRRLSNLASQRDLQPIFDLEDSDRVIGRLPAGTMESTTCDLGKRLAAGNGRTGPTNSLLPKVLVSSEVIDEMAARIQESRRLRGDVETGCALIGKILKTGQSRAIEITGLLDEGPKAKRSGGHHQADRAYQQNELEMLQLIDREIMHLGDAHLHPGSLDTCSSGDYRTDVANVRESRSQEMVFIIVTTAAGRWREEGFRSVLRNGLKFDFFYLGKSSNYDYRRVQPDVVHKPMLRLGANLRKFIEASPSRARLDLGNLQRLAHYEMRISELMLPGQQPRSCIDMSHKTGRFRILMTFDGDPRVAPEVYLDTGRDVLRYQVEEMNGRWNHLVWFTPIVLEVDSSMSARSKVDGATALAARLAPSAPQHSGQRPSKSNGLMLSDATATPRQDVQDGQTNGDQRHSSSTDCTADQT